MTPKFYSILMVFNFNLKLQQNKITIDEGINGGWQILHSLTANTYSTTLAMYLYIYINYEFANSAHTDLSFLILCPLHPFSFVQNAHKNVSTPQPNTGKKEHWKMEENRHE